MNDLSLLARAGALMALTDISIPTGVLIEIPSDADLLDRVSNSVMVIVISLAQIGLGALELGAIKQMREADIPVCFFILDDELDDTERDSITAFVSSTFKTNGLKSDVFIGDLDKLRLLAKSMGDDPNLITLRNERIAHEETRAKLEALNNEMSYLKGSIAGYLNARMRCDSASKQGRKLEQAVMSALSDALQRVNESALHNRCERELRRSLKVVASGAWEAEAQKRLTSLLRRWQNEQLDNMLLDIKRFADVPITLEAEYRDEEIVITANMKEVCQKDYSAEVLPVVGAAMLTKIAIVTFLPILAPIAIPAAIGGAFAAWRGVSNRAKDASFQRFYREAAAQISDACRNTVVSTHKLLRHTAEAVSESIRKQTAATIEDILRNEAASSDVEANQQATRLRALLASPSEASALAP